MNSSTARARGRIVVGADGPPASAAAVRWALEAAAQVDAWLSEPAATEAHALVRAVLDEACQGCRPDNVRTFVMEGDPVNCLLEHATGADLLVLGDRGAGGFLGLQLGSVASTCARSATCAVLIVPTSRERRTVRARTAVGALR